MAFLFNYWAFWVLMFTVYEICSTPTVFPQRYNPCCTYPCLHGGICQEKKFGYSCDCHNTGYYGRNCATATWKTTFEMICFILKKSMLHLIYETLNFFKQGKSHYSPAYQMLLRDLVNGRRTSTYHNVHSDLYISLDTHYDMRSLIRLSPPVPRNCPTPSGCAGKASALSVPEIYEKLLKRRQFRVNTNVNLLFVIYGQHFFLQFLEHGDMFGITCSHIYSQHPRRFTDGKIQTEKYKGEDYPLVTRGIKNKVIGNGIDKKDSISELNSLTYALATLWVREHNRVCEIVKNTWPDWNDEQLYQTARNIITGEVLVLTVSEWLPVLLGERNDFLYAPSTVEEGYSASNRLPVETLLAFHAPHLLPDKLFLANNTVKLRSCETNSLNVYFVKNVGLYNVLQGFAVTLAGQAGPSNAADSMEDITKQIMEIARQLRIPSLNKVRHYFEEEGHRGLCNFAGDNKALTAELKKLYLKMDRVEYVPGILIEQSSTPLNPLGKTATSLIGRWLLKAAITHPLATKGLWKPSTFGGMVGWNIVNSVRLSDLVCQNVNDSSLCTAENRMSFRPRCPKRMKIKENRKPVRTKALRVKQKVGSLV